ncbi:ubiquitin carboxyl-terminal hydrolase 4 [Favolaschia claudopus]|uniref:ubiquitinyl hydrolase 1 n=1 Tax=Favolaschia claudopus TaxID=2862362 RepID=A0AAW0BFN3_9AGAR
MLGGVSVPPSPGLGGFGGLGRPGSNPNGVGRHFDNMTTSQIKASTMEAVRRESKGAGALALLKAARTQIAAAREYDGKGELKNALASYTKGGTLIKAALDSTEYKREAPGGVVHKECLEFQRLYSVDMAARMSAIEETLKAMEKADDGPNTASMGGIQDRIKALQSNGLPLVEPPKRFAQSHHPAQAAKYPTPPTSPRVFTTPNTASSSLVPSTPVSATSSPHTLVSPSSFGPPSPASSPSSSPVHTFSPALPSTVNAPPLSPSRSYSISSTEAKFPSIDELDESFTLPSLPSVPRDLPVPIASSSSSSSSPSFRSFLPLERPSSTPVTPTTGSFASRPPSPTKPQAPLKPSGLSSHAKVPLPINGSAFPDELQGYLRDYKVLLLDVRNRADFDKSHIRHEAVVCVEPIILLRTGMNAEKLEDSMVNAPTSETTMFKNRDKFDLVVLYDQSSQNAGPTNSPMSILMNLISETAFTKLLKRMPMVLVGGLDGWRKDMGEQATVASSPPRPLPPMPSSPTSTSSAGIIPNGISPSTSMTNGVNGHGVVPLVNGYSSTSMGLTNGFASSSSSTSGADPHEVWTPRSRSGTNPGQPAGTSYQQHRSNYSLDQSIGGHSRSPAEITYPSNYQSSVSSSSSGSRRPTLRTAPSTGSFAAIPETHASPPPLSMMNGTSTASSSITYPSFAPRITPSPSLNHASPPSAIASPSIASPPLASINPTLSRRRSDYIDQSAEAVSSLHQQMQTRNQIPAIDYPSRQILRPPPAVASSALERQDRPRSTNPNAGGLSVMGMNGSVGDLPRISSDYPPTYWYDVGVNTSGLKNLGNTCYMNAPIQCLAAAIPFAQFFANGRWKTAVNTVNPLGSKGLLSDQFSSLIRQMWGGEFPYIIPMDFRKVVCKLNSQYHGSNQHDSQEFLSFLLDGIHEDLNRLLVQPSLTKTPEQEAELERLSPQIASEQEWRLWKTRNDSIIVDFFQGQFRSRLQCLTCQTTSTTYNVFSILQLPIPQGRASKVPLQNCLDALFNTETLDKDDAWDCPKCKTKRRATKQLSLARLPPILVIHLKRFEIHGRFSDKIDTFVDYPTKGLDLTNFMPPPLPPGADKSHMTSMSPDDPRSQVPPYRYNLYGVTMHSGNLTSGHYTAFVADRAGWKSCDDSSVRPVDEKAVVSQRAYVLFYKRTKP